MKICFLAKVVKQMPHNAVSLAIKLSVPDKRGVSGQKPKKADFLTQQIEW